MRSITRTTDKEKEERWAEHLWDILDKEFPEEPAVGQEADQDLDITQPPTNEQIMETITDLKHGKPPGHVQLSVEVFSVSSRGCSSHITLFERVWNGDGKPGDRRRGALMFSVLFGCFGFRTLKLRSFGFWCLSQFAGFLQFSLWFSIQFC